MTMAYFRGSNSAFCRSWRMVGEDRVVCGATRGHAGPHGWAAAMEQEKQHQAKLARIAEAVRLLGEHAEVGCEQCDTYVSALFTGKTPEQAIGLRCEWAQGLQLTVGDGV